MKRKEPYAAMIPEKLVIQLWRISKVEEMVGLKIPTIYKWIREGKFPKTRKSGRLNVWSSVEIKAYIENILSKEENNDYNHD
jgi:predicted DNA-binding transcriptional regulator AlpA